MKLGSKENIAIKNQLEEKKNNKPLSKNETIEMKVHNYLEKMKPEIEKALPRHIGADRMARIAYTTIRTTPDLLDCSMGSLMGSVMQASALGLEPNLLGQCYIIPYKNQATFILGYRGMINLARRSGEIQTIYAHVVRENDEFSYQYGLDQDLKHIPAEGDRGEIKGAYMVAKFKDGGYYFEYMPLVDILKRKEKSPSKNSEYSPWNDIKGIGYEEMVKKTVIRHAFKYLPVSVEIMNNVESKEEIVIKGVKDMSEDDFIELEVEETVEDLKIEKK